MSQSIKSRSKRLSTFVRANLNGQANHEEPVHESLDPEKRDDAPQPDTLIPTREELIDVDRVPISKGGRLSTNHRQDEGVTNRTLLQSPRKVVRASPSPARGRVGTKPLRGNIFEGSELGDSFMLSGRSSPQDSVEVLDMEDPVEQARVLEVVRPAHRGHLHNQLDLHAHEDDRQAFHVGEDGKMRVVTGTARHNASHMKDGFQDGFQTAAANGQHRSSSSVERHAKLPMREVKIRKPRTDMHDDYGAKDEPKSPSPTYEVKRQTRPVREEPTRANTLYSVEDDMDFSDENELQVTPKAKPSKVAPQMTLMESSMSPTRVLHKPSKEKKRRRPSADYDDKILSSMTFSELQREPFDLDPAKAAVQNGHGSGVDKLPAKLEQFRQQDENEQRHMFATMPIEDWEASGDWFVDQFSDLMQRLKGARQSKRRMIEEFEHEAADREEAVRLRSEAVDRKLAKMRQDGQRVVEARDR